MLKLNENPPILLPDVESLADLTDRWWVGHTRSRFEKAFAWDLLRRGIGYFLPLTERVRMSGGRKRRVMFALFPSYVFFCGTDEDRYEAMTTNRLHQALEVPDQAKLVRELLAIEKALAGRAELDLYRFAAVGKRCRVTAGPLAGLEGVVVRRNEKAHMVLEVSMLAQGAALEIHADLLEPAD